MWINSQLEGTATHRLQTKLLELMSTHDLGRMTLRKIGEQLERAHPQTVKHHLGQLEQKGLIVVDRERKIIRATKPTSQQNDYLVSIPILGSADCGPATVVAQENVQGYLKISARLINRKSGLFALRAQGDSMNRADVDGNTIEDGDYVIVDMRQRAPQNKHCVVSVVDGLANIKQFIKDSKNRRVLLLSQSTHDFPPIVVHPEDVHHLICGRVVQVVKKPRS